MRLAFIAAGKAAFPRHRRATGAWQPVGADGFVSRRTPNHHFPVAANVLARQFTALAPGAVWVAYITYIPTGEGCLLVNGISALQAG